jgi:hypothetical protein
LKRQLLCQRSRKYLYAATETKVVRAGKYISRARASFDEMQDEAAVVTARGIPGLRMRRPNRSPNFRRNSRIPLKITAAAAAEAEAATGRVPGSSSRRSFCSSTSVITSFPIHRSPADPCHPSLSILDRASPLSLTDGRTPTEGRSLVPPCLGGPSAGELYFFFILRTIFRILPQFRTIGFFLRMLT